uniref:Magnesium-dependent phosphatase 1 n=2 Tax=Lygus hesperus TaxID=30085 RepID=A0A0A9ZEJ3_LYGHE
MVTVPRKLPKLVVFDLDYTLWPFWVDTHVTPPFRKLNGQVVDTGGKKIEFYPEVPQILQTLQDLNIPIGVASRTGEVDGANQLIQLFDWDKYFWQKEIYPGCKKTHFNSFKKSSGTPFEEMLFFDDEHRNIVDLQSFKVTAILVENGMTMKELQRGLDEFAK